MQCLFGHWLVAPVLIGLGLISRTIQNSSEGRLHWRRGNLQLWPVEIAFGVGWILWATIACFG